MRIPIALRLFLTVLMTTLVITTVSLGILHWAMQNNFSRYVTQVELQKLGHLTNNLAEVYQVYGTWQKAIENTTNDIHDIIPEQDRTLLPYRWLRRQYDIAQQQSDIIQNPAMFQSRLSKAEEEDFSKPPLFIPSHFEPFKFPKRLQQTNKTANEQQSAHHSAEKERRWLFPMPDRLGVASRLILYDANKDVIAGEPASDIPMQEIEVDGDVVGYLGLRPALDTDDALSINFFSNQQRYLLLVYALSFLVSLIVALALANWFRKPIHRLLQTASELSKGNYQHHVEIKSNDELGDLSQVINQLAVILDQHEQSRRQWVADTSHELKTPLSVLQAQIEALQDGVRQPTAEHLTRMMNQVMSLKKLTQDLSDLALADAMQMQCYLVELNPWDLVLQEVENFQPKFMEKCLQVSIEGQGCLLTADPDRLRQIIVNLLSNSVRYTEAHGQVHIHSEVKNQYWVLHIDDSPLGLSDEQLAQLGERFYRVDDSRTRGTGGTGLGLALSKKIAQILGGELQFSHSPLGGLRSTVMLKGHKQKNEYSKE